MFISKIHVFRKYNKVLYTYFEQIVRYYHFLPSRACIVTPRLQLAVEAGAKCAGVDGIDGDHHALVDHRVERVGADLFGGEEGEGGEEGCTVRR